MKKKPREWVTSANVDKEGRVYVKCGVPVGSSIGLWPGFDNIMVSIREIQPPRPTRPRAGAAALKRRKK